MVNMFFRLVIIFLSEVVASTVCSSEGVLRDTSGFCGMLHSDRVITSIDVSSQLVTIKNTITLSNSLFDHPVNCYIFTIDPLWEEHLSYIQAQDSEGQPLRVNRLRTNNNLAQFNVTFQDYIQEEESYTMSVYTIYTHYLKSFPKKVKQGEQHLVLFSFNVYFYSDSLPKVQTTLLNLGSHKLLSVDGENYSEMYNEKKDGYVLRYGPYFDIPTFSEYLSTVHYNNKAPFLTVEDLERNVLISHWGYANVWEKILLVHSGPQFTGPYERPTGQNSNQDTRIESFTTILPKNAFDIYIKDDIGLVWSFDIYDEDNDNTWVKIRPRFTMYGGWKTQYEIGYSVDISNYLRYSESSYFNKEFYFEFPLVDIVFQHMFIKEAQINVILPEGSIFHGAIYPDISENISDIYVHKYCFVLDTICRQKITFKRFNLVENHKSNFAITYAYPQIFLLLKPLVVSMAFFFLFMTTIAMSRLKSHSSDHSQQPIAVKPTVSVVNNEHNKAEILSVKKKKSRKLK